MEAQDNSRKKKLESYMSRASCPPCARKSHGNCTEEKLRDEKFITGNIAHCYCYWTNHCDSSRGW